MKKELNFRNEFLKTPKVKDLVNTLKRLGLSKEEILKKVDQIYGHAQEIKKTN